MIINEYHEAIAALKVTYGRKYTGKCHTLIFDLDESLDPQDVVYAYRQC